MGLHTGLRWFVVVGHDRERRIGAGGLCVFRKVDRLAGRIRSGSRDHRCGERAFEAQAIVAGCEYVIARSRALRILWQRKFLARRLT